jgi:RecA-family ATPase
VIGSPGGVGKSSLAIGMAISVATGQELLGDKIRGGSNLKALVINGEDSTDEIRRRVYAFCLAHGVAESDLNGLTVVGADDLWVQRISLLKTNEKGMSALNQDGIDALQLALDALHPDVIVLDPLVSFCAGGNMNDNAVMSSVMRKLKEIAARYRCAMLIVSASVQCAGFRMPA